jgi:hypothetical protein
MFGRNSGQRQHGKLLTGTLGWRDDAFDPRGATYVRVGGSNAGLVFCFQIY